MCESKTHVSFQYEPRAQEALAWLRRHLKQSSSEPSLFSGAVKHLQLTTGASREAAENITARAYSELRSEVDPRYLDVSRSTGSVAVLVDPRSGMTHAVPVSRVFERLIDTPAKARS